MRIIRFTGLLSVTVPVLLSCFLLGCVQKKNQPTGATTTSGSTVRKTAKTLEATPLNVGVAPGASVIPEAVNSGSSKAESGLDLEDSKKMAKVDKHDQSETVNTQ